MAIPPPKESEVKEPDKIVFVDFFSLTLSNKRNKVSGGHDRRSQRGGQE